LKLNFDLTEMIITLSPMTDNIKSCVGIGLSNYNYDSLAT